MLETRVFLWMVPSNLPSLTNHSPAEFLPALKIGVPTPSLLRSCTPGCVHEKVCFLGTATIRAKTTASVTGRTFVKWNEERGANPIHRWEEDGSAKKSACTASMKS